MPTLLVRSLLLVVAAAFGLDAAEARESGNYSFVEIGATGGSVVGGAGELDSNPAVFANESLAGAGALSLAGGQPWFCSTPGCSVSVGPLAGLAWAEAATNPFAGSIGLRTGAFQNGGPAPLNCATLPGGIEICQPVDPWGAASAYGYNSRYVEVTSDGTLAPGAAVDVRAAVDVTGAFTDDLVSGDAVDEPTGTLQAVIFVSRIGSTASDPYWNSGPYLNYGSVADILGDPAVHGGELLGVLNFVTDSLNGIDVTPLLADFTIAHSGDMLVNAAVGDRLLFETMLYVTTVLRNDSRGHVAWSEFDQTLSSNLTALTPGAALATIPVPPALPLLAAGLLALARRRRAT